MLLQAFTVFDSKTEAYLKPFFCLSIGEAIRTFTDAVNEPGSPFNRHPADYTLFGIGSFDDSNMKLAATTGQNLGCAIQFLLGDQDV